MTYGVTITQPEDLTEFKATARRLLAACIPPADVTWLHGADTALFSAPVPPNQKAISVPRSFADLAGSVICHRDERTWSFLYQALWRIDHGERSLMAQTTDPLTDRLRRMAVAVRHDQHRMTAFVRFKETIDPLGPLMVAWYEPRHRILKQTAAFFIDRFASMRFSILTPDLTLHWGGNEMRFAAGLRRQDAVSDDALEDWWRRYYTSIFNPARINPRLLHTHMPRRFWRDLPEATTIMALINEAGMRTDQMISRTPTD